MVSLYQILETLNISIYNFILYHFVLEKENEGKQLKGIINNNEELKKNL